MLVLFPRLISACHSRPAWLIVSRLRAAGFSPRSHRTQFPLSLLACCCGLRMSEIVKLRMGELDRRRCADAEPGELDVGPRFFRRRFVSPSALRSRVADHLTAFLLALAALLRTLLHVV